MKNTLKSLIIYVLIFVVIAGMVYLYTGGQPAQKEKPVEYSEFVSEIINENVKQLSVVGTNMTGILKDESIITTYAPSIIDYSLLNEGYIMPQIEAGTLVMTSEAPVTTPWYISMLPYLITIAMFVIFWVFFMNQSQGGAGKAMSFGKSKARLYKTDEGKKIGFQDVAGLDEEKEELQEIVDFLKNPAKYAQVGARIPKGVLLVGPPGTGKTYLSKATAGEAGVPFFSISGSDFVEMFVGVGASRVRDLFDQAKKNAPSIIFIDEIDAVGRRRGAGFGGGHDEREQTLNQMLVEMDGFGINEGVIVFAATNRADILDPALLRPGRFDRRIMIGLPDIRGREEIFNVHAKNKPLDESVDPKVFARRTPGFTPADIENILNEAALLTARRNGKTITMPEIEEAITKVMMGPEKRNRVISENERRLTAYHEAGHAVAMRMLPNSDSPVHQITIIPRGGAGGFTMFLPEEERTFETKTRMSEHIVHLLGGRVAEKLVLGDISTGASNDIERATAIARAMVTKFGMSDVIGPVNYGDADEVFLGKDFSTRRNYSEEMASEIDREIKRIVENAFKIAEKILSENRDKLELVAETLLDVETLDGPQFEALFTGELSKEEIEEEIKVSTAAKKKKIIDQNKAAEETEKKAQADKMNISLSTEKVNPDINELIEETSFEEKMNKIFGLNKSENQGRVVFEKKETDVKSENTGNNAETITRNEDSSK